MGTMADDAKYLVNLSGNTAEMAVFGKASYLNCRPAGEFFASVIAKGCGKIVVDCAACTGMDSTFLGTIAGAAIKLRKSGGGNLTLLNLNARNREVLENLGIGKLVEVSSGALSHAETTTNIGTAHEQTKGVLRAHENLVEANPANMSKFENVIAYLKKEAQS